MHDSSFNLLGCFRNVFAEREGLDFSFERNAVSGWVPLTIKMCIKPNGDLVVLSDNDLGIFLFVIEYISFLHKLF